MKLRFFWVSFYGLGIFVFSSSFASKFVNQFTEFELPAQWTCSLENAEWVCQNSNEAKKKEAVIVLAAKLKGDQDSLDQYLTYLKAPKVFVSAQGKSIKSESKYAKTISINGHPWVDSLHMASELPGYFTRYLATVKQDIGVLVTYSIQKSKYQDYFDQFENMTKTLKVFRKVGGINIAPQNGTLFQQNAQLPGTLGSGSDTAFSVAPIQGGADETARSAGSNLGDDSYKVILMGVVLIFIVFIFLKKKRR